MVGLQPPLIKRKSIAVGGNERRMSVIATMPRPLRSVPNDGNRVLTLELDVADALILR
jgi:hypothetical protein